MAQRHGLFVHRTLHQILKEKSVKPRQFYQPREKNMNAEQRREYLKKVGLTPFILRHIRNSCVNVATFTHENVMDRARVVMSDILLAWAEADRLKKTFSHFMTKKMIPIAKRMREAFRKR